MEKMEILGFLLTSSILGESGWILVWGRSTAVRKGFLGVTEEVFLTRNFAILFTLLSSLAGLVWHMVRGKGLAGDPNLSCAGD